MYASNFREIARNALRGKWKKMAWLTFLAFLLGAGSVTGFSSISLPDTDVIFNLDSTADPEATRVLLLVTIITFVLSLWIFLMGSAVRVGQNNMYICLLDGETPRAGMLFPKGNYGKILGMNFLRGLFVSLWSLLLVIPGVIAAYSYCMADYILATHPEMGAMEALRESKKRMKGRRWRLFCLELSFIGWELLSIVPAWLLALIGGFIAAFRQTSGVSANEGAILIFAGMFFIGGIISAIAMMFVYVYLNTAVIAFFRDAERSADWKSEAREGEEYAKANYGENESRAYNYQDAVPHFAQPAPAEPVLSADESVARDVFIQHKCSYALLEKVGLLEEYRALHASAISEARWKRDYADSLMRRFDQDPAVLDDILALCAEYGMDDLATRALQRIERHLRQETLPDQQILNMCGRVLVLLGCGAFDDNPGFVARRKEQISEMAGRLENRLSESDPNGAWREALAAVREMCK